MLFIARIIAVVILVFGLLGCSGLGIKRPSVESAALMDVGTTAIGLSRGAVELNPLGFWGTTIAKLYYLYGLRPEYDPATRVEMDSWLTGVFVGASVNNVIQIIWAPHLAISAAMGMIVGYSTYHSTPAESLTRP